MEFKILKKSKKSRARLGLIKTKNGIVKTPALVGVGTQATVKALDTFQARDTKSQLLICNTFHLHLKPGEKIIEKHGGLHSFMNWNSPLMTDSGGYQVFSLGFGMDKGLGKILREGDDKKGIKKGQQPKKIKITDKGVYFKSPVDGRQLFLGPKESISIQNKLGADIIFAFDECTPPTADYDYTKESLKKTHKWAKQCLEYHKTDQALYGIVQGSRYEDLRKESAEFINSLGFDGYGIGGDLGESKTGTKKVLDWVIPLLDEKKPRHLLGIGKIEDMELIVKGGVDTFDCTVPTHYARHGTAFITKGKIDLHKTKFLTDKKPIDSKCGCPVCKRYSRGYICHLLKAKEISGLSLITMHNLYFFNSYIEEIRKKIEKGLI